MLNDCGNVYDFFQRNSKTCRRGEGNRVETPWRRVLYLLRRARNFIANGNVGNAIDGLLKTLLRLPHQIDRKGLMQEDAFSTRSIVRRFTRGRRPGPCMARCRSPVSPRWNITRNHVMEPGPLLPGGTGAEAVETLFRALTPRRLHWNFSPDVCIDGSGRVYYTPTDAMNSRTPDCAAVQDRFRTGEK